MNQTTTQRTITPARDGLPIPFKVFGLQRSGTNLVVAQMTRNFHVHSLEHEAEWKHGPVRMVNRTWNGIPARFVLCVKNPYAWAVSCYRYFQRASGHDPTVAPQFQQNPSMSFDRFLTTPSYGFESPIHRWNQMNRLWLATLPAERTQLVRQEDQLTQQVQVLAVIEEHLGLQRRSRDLVPIEEKIDFNARAVGSMNTEYYRGGQYMRDYSNKSKIFVQQIIDQALLQRLGYS